MKVMLEKEDMEVVVEEETEEREVEVVEEEKEERQVKVVETGRKEKGYEGTKN